MERAKSVVSIRIYNGPPENGDEDNGGSKDFETKPLAHLKKTVEKKRETTSNVVSDVKKKEIMPGIEKETPAGDDTNMPPPTDFAGFMKWICNYWFLPYNIAVIKKKIELPVAPISKKRTQSIKLQKSKISYLDKTRSVIEKASKIEKLSSLLLFDPNSVPISAYYDYFDNLIEIEISHCPFKMPLEVIKAIRICARFYPHLTKLVVRNNNFFPMVSHELSLLLNVSNISEVYLYNVYLIQGNYYYLLEHPVNLKYLAICRCSINDSIVKEIAFRLTFDHLASVALLTLDLSANNITDEGARYLADMLRTNRHLLHLNLSGNRLTDIGSAFLFNILKEFPLTEIETLGMKQRKVEYYKQRTEVFKKYLYDIWMKSQELQLRRPTMASKLGKIKDTPAPMINDIFPMDEMKKLQSLKSGSEQAEKMTALKMGTSFVDLFDTPNTVSKGGKLYSIGNFRLASLNLVYNNITYLGLKHIVSVLKYQAKVIVKPARCSGLMKIELAGNYLPIDCYEYEMMIMFLKRNIIEHIPVQTTPPRKGYSFSKRSGPSFY